MSLVLDSSLTLAWYFPDEGFDATDVLLRELADRYGLTIYDAAYLELAQRRRLPLASLDAALVEAVKAAGVAVSP